LPENQRSQPVGGAPNVPDSRLAGRKSRLAEPAARGTAQPVPARPGAGADASGQLKYLAERIPATFIYAGVNVEGSGLFAGTRGQQIAVRFGVITCQAFPYGTAAQRRQWQALIATLDLEQSLRLHRHRPGQLLRLDAYLHQRTDGMIGSLSHLIRARPWKPSWTAPRRSPGTPWTASAWTTPPRPPAPAARPPGDAMPAPAEPLRRLPVPARLIARETIGSFLTRLAFANSLRVPHLLALAAITTGTRSFSPATDDTRGWSESAPDQIAALAGRPLPELAAAIPSLAGMTPPDTTLLRACGHCTAAKNVTGMVIIRARARDYLCLRHQQWLRGIHRPSLAAVPEVTESQRRHDRRTGNIPDQDIARAHGQARDITGQWLADGWHPALTERWQDRDRRLSAALRGPGAVLADVITHPEILAVARLLIASRRPPGIQPEEIAARLGFPCPSRPHPVDPLRRHLK
jgi:hypothetical protein